MIATPKSLRLLACTPVTASRPLFVFLPGMDGSGALLQPQVAGLSTGFDIRCLSIPPDDLRGWEELTEHVAALIQMEQQLPGVNYVGGRAAWRLALLKQFRLEDLPLDRVRQPVLILASEADRLLPSQREAKRLARFLPDTTIVQLPNSGHACLLETQLNLSAILKSQDLFSDLPASTLPIGAPAQAAEALW